MLKKCLPLILFVCFICFCAPGYAQTKDALMQSVTDAVQINPTTVQFIFEDCHRRTIDFYGENIFRVFEDSSGGMVRNPKASSPADILVKNPRKPVELIKITKLQNEILVSTADIIVHTEKKTGAIKVVSSKTGKVAMQMLAPVQFGREQVSLILKENPDEYFYGGGVQNGRFSHKGTRIAIENQNSWTDGGVASPTPFYWSTDGYAITWHTFAQGNYDFGAKEKGKVVISHQTDYLDLFIMIDKGVEKLLSDFYQLTGNPILLPKFAFYEGHLNAYNRDYWKEDSSGILFEDGKKYKESQKNDGGTKESLNGEKNNYQFSARAVLDRYKKHDMPFGWILPNDGYGAGYGQTVTLDSNIANLKSFGDYARKNGVEIGLWTQSDLHPKEGITALLQRDIIKEVRDAGVRVLKTDVAWVGEGYSFGLNGVADVGQIVPYYGNNDRPFIISLDGWAGTQRYASVWSGDQTGGNWEYIRFHIPTFTGSGLSGQPNITSDMDGIFGGKNSVVNAREFEWKAFTPMQLNMDGWGSNPKYPQSLNEPTTSINRTYLKLKSAMMPYTYSIAKEAVTGMPMIRAMFLQTPNKYTLGSATDYQYMYGPSMLVAPVYQDTKMDDKGNDVRNNIYLPKGKWIDYFSGETYEGNAILNSFPAPVWKLPLFVKAGAIIPMTNPNNNVSEMDKTRRMVEVYPGEATTFKLYDDDGKTEAYKNGTGATTLISASANGGSANFSFLPAVGNFEGFEKNQTTELKINVTAKPKDVIARINNKVIKLQEVKNQTAFDNGSNVFFYNIAPDLNQFSTKGSSFASVKMIKNPQLWVKIEKTDVSKNKLSVDIKGFEWKAANNMLQKSGTLNAPAGVAFADSNMTSKSATLSWNMDDKADYYDIMFDDMRYTGIRTNQFSFDNLQPENTYDFQIRSANKQGFSPWKSLKAKTKVNPLELAITGISAVSTASDQEGSEVSQLFDFDEKNMWHTEYGKKQLPFELVIDLHSINQIDGLEYLPRSDAGNGTIFKGEIAYSSDKKQWTPAGTFDWKKDNTVKQFVFADHPTTRYIKMSVSSSANNYGTGRELYVFKVPGSKTLLPGDINNDKKVDENDLTSYLNYAGLKKGDADFDGYISNGDINKNGLIDAYDISVAATQVDMELLTSEKLTPVSGTLEISPDKKNYKKGESIEITVKGINLNNVNALSLALPYNPQQYEFVSVESLKTVAMQNFTYDRTHSDGTRVLYPAFVNVGKKPLLNGSEHLFIIKLKAKQNLTFDLKEGKIILADRDLNYLEF